MIKSNFLDTNTKSAWYVDDQKKVIPVTIMQQDNPVLKDQVIVRYHAQAYYADKRFLFATDHECWDFINGKINVPAKKQAVAMHPFY